MKRIPLHFSLVNRLAVHHPFAHFTAVRKMVAQSYRFAGFGKTIRLTDDPLSKPKTLAFNYGEFATVKSLEFEGFRITAHAVSCV